LVQAQGQGENTSTGLPSISKQRREEIRQCLIGPLSAMTGFAAMSEPDRREAGRFWIEALAEYEPEEIRAAFKAFTRTGNKYPNPQAIVALIMEDRKSRIPLQSRATPLPPMRDHSPEETRRKAEMGNAWLREMQAKASRPVR
jgi:hypothetical protein